MKYLIDPRHQCCPDGYYKNQYNNPVKHFDLDECYKWSTWIQTGNGYFKGSMGDGFWTGSHPYYIELQLGYY